MGTLRKGRLSKGKRLLLLTLRRPSHLFLVVVHVGDTPAAIVDDRCRRYQQSLDVVAVGIELKAKLALLDLQGLQVFRKSKATCASAQGPKLSLLVRYRLAIRPLPLWPVSFRRRFLFTASDAVVDSVPTFSVCCTVSITGPESRDSVSEQSATRFSRIQAELHQDGELDGKEVNDVSETVTDEYQRLLGEQ